ncbi:PH domain-containing protein [Candidatus Uhrbacteria bacterium]|nr:PH domain-containing protein [Candidatus Uhrbacteria bacterium]
MGYFSEQVTLDSSESIQGLFRSHFFHLLVRIAVPFLGLCVFFLFLFPLFRNGLGGVAVFFAGILFCSLTIAHFVMAWYGTLFILTNRRLLAIRRTGLFKKQAQEIVLENVSELSYNTRGLVEMIFRFGDVKLTLYTASHSFTLHDIPNPHDVLNAISRQMVLAKKPDLHTDEIMTSEENIKKGKVQTLNGGKSSPSAHHGASH